MTPAERVKLWRHKNLEHYRSWARKYTRYRRLNGSAYYRYGITKAAFREMIFSQGGKCMICNGSPKKLNVDHNHATGMVRGLLCRRCNMWVGLVERNPERQEVIRAYLTMEYA